MRRIKSVNTKPEMTVRKLIHSLGFRYRLHRKDLPGKPDLVFGPKRKVVFVHGCFWHQHSASQCKKVHKPKSNSDYWTSKLNRNIERDKENLDGLTAMGWDVLVIWECEMEDMVRLTAKIEGFLTNHPK